jgi:cation:H+ antiporter
MPSAPKVVLRDGGTLLIASGALAFLARLGGIGRQAGLVLVAAFLVYAVAAIVSDWRRSAEHSVACAEAEKRSTGEYPTVGGGLFVLIVGAVCLLIGAHFLTGGALAIAAAWNLSVSAIAVTLVSLAVSLPVLVVTVIAVARGHTQIAIGHLLTASIFNLFGALGAAAIVRPLRVAADFASLDVFVVLGASVLLLPLLASNWRLTRPKAALLLLAYFAYVGYLAYSHGVLPTGFPRPA